MTKKLLNLGTTPNDQAGDSLRSAGGKINDNFNELYSALGNGTNLTISPVVKSNSYDDLSNKPFIPLDISQLTDIEGVLDQTQQVNSDWDATTGVSEILNKPTIPTDISELTDNESLLSQSVSSSSLFNGEYTADLGEDGVLSVNNGIVTESSYVLYNSGNISGRINNSVSDGGGLQIEGFSDLEIKVTQGEGEETAIFGFGSNGVIELPVGGDITMDGQSVLGGGVRTVEVPTSSAGSEGDQEGDLAFSNTHMYYCSSTYSATPITVSWSNVTNFITNPNYIQADIANPSELSGVLQVTNCAVDGVTGVTVTIASIEIISGNTYKLFPLESGFQSTYGDSELINVGLSIWKRVAWSEDTW